MHEPIHNMLAAPASSAVVFLLTLAIAAVWVFSHLLRNVKLPWPLIIGATAMRIALGTVTLWACSGVILSMGFGSASVSFETPCPLWLLALATAICVETVFLLYSLEHKDTQSRARHTLVALRSLLIISIAFILAEPHLNTTAAKNSDMDSIAILIDNSASMLISQKFLGQAEKLRLAESLDIIHRPYPMDILAEDLQTLHTHLVTTQKIIRIATGTDISAQGEQLDQRRVSVGKMMRGNAERLRLYLDKTSTPDAAWAQLQLSNDVTNRLREVRSSISTITNLLERSAAVLQSQGKVAKQFAKIRQDVISARKSAERILTITPQLTIDLDAACYAHLPESIRKKIDLQSEGTRLRQGWDVLLTRPKRKTKLVNAPSLLEQLVKRYKVHIYTFSDKATRLTVSQWARTKADQDDNTGSANKLASRLWELTQLPTSRQNTNIAAALDKVLSDATNDSEDADDANLTGVILLSDMQHNAPGDPRGSAGRYGKLKIPLIPIVLGARQPPRDASVLSVKAPRQILPDDSLNVSVKMKFDGMKGQTATVQLLHNKTVVDTKSIPIDSEGRVERGIELTHTPLRSGKHEYRVRIEPIDGEILSENNDYDFSVTVRDDTIKVLVIENRPRWEFRYLKNLFASRDSSVKLQYVLMRPDRAFPNSPLPYLAATTMAPAGRLRATALPQTQADWMKFDVIILGDVPYVTSAGQVPTGLNNNALLMLNEFVTRRGGALICIAGPGHMPTAYRHTSLAGLLPVDIKLTEPYNRMTGFQIAATTDGRASGVMSQSTSLSASSRIWKSIPGLFWRTTAATARKGATVLAYAREANAPPPRAANFADAEDSQALLNRFNRYTRKNSLISIHSKGMGRVMFIGTDRTWRMRYGVGDTYHHRFWSQVMRWAISERLGEGTTSVRIGAGKPHYKLDEAVSAKAQINWGGHKPKMPPDVSVRLFRDGELVLEKKMRHLLSRESDQKDYTTFIVDLGRAGVGALATGGRHRLELAGTDVAETLRQEGAATRVFTHFTVDQAVSTEQLDMSCDRHLARNMASASGGEMLEPSDAHRAIEVLTRNDAPKQNRQAVKIPLWDSPILLILMLGLATSEWLMRKRAKLV